jgi:hypothetical protein
MCSGLPVTKPAPMPVNLLLYKKYWVVLVFNRANLNLVAEIVIRFAESNADVVSSNILNILKFHFKQSDTIIPFQPSIA